MKKDKPSECGITHPLPPLNRGENTLFVGKESSHNSVLPPLNRGENTPPPSPLLRGDKGVCTIRNPQSAFCSGFTLLEVIVALAIVSISLGVYMSLIGTSFRLKGKVDDHAKKVLVAIQKAEEAHLGLLGDKRTLGDSRRAWEGVTEDGTTWKVVENDKKDIEEKNKPVDGIIFYDVVAGGVNISSIRSENILAQSALDNLGQQTGDEKAKSKTGSPTPTQKTEKKAKR